MDKVLYIAMWKCGNYYCHSYSWPIPYPELSDDFKEYTKKFDITIQGLFININHFANKLGIPKDKIIANQEESETCFKNPS